MQVRYKKKKDGTYTFVEDLRLGMRWRKRPKLARSTVYNWLGRLKIGAFLIRDSRGKYHAAVSRVNAIRFREAFRKAKDGDYGR